jgi:hypothetical protein
MPGQFPLNFCFSCMKNGLHSGDLNPRPLSHESSALTTRPQILAFNLEFYCEKNDPLLQQHTLIRRSNELW